MKRIRRAGLLVVTALLASLPLPATADVPVPIKQAYTRGNGSNPFVGAELNGFLYFGASDEIRGQEFWRVPIAGGEAELVKDIDPGSNSSNPSNFVNADGTLFFLVNNNQLWMSDGTEAGTQFIRGFSQILAGQNQEMVTLGNQVIFKAEDSSFFGRELWVSDGVTTTRFDICPGACDSNPFFMTAAGNRVFFRANDTSDTELWKYEGGAVSQVGDINTLGSSSPGPFGVIGTDVIFAASGDDGSGGTEPGLFVSNGTGNTKIAGPAQSFFGFTEIVVAGGVAYFDGIDNSGGASTGQELWWSNGTAPGTGLLADIKPGTGSSNPNDLTAVGSTVFFSADDGTNGRELWFNNGTGGGTVLLEMNTGSGSATVESMVALNGSQAFFVGDNGDGSGREPWVSNGSLGGTGRIADLEPGSNSSTFGPVVVAQGVAFFPSSAQSEGDELWRSNGTAGGTVLAAEINGSFSGFGTDEITVLSGIGYYCFDDGIHGLELWRTNGTTSGTFMVQDLNPGRAEGCLGDLGLLGSTIFFRGNNGTNDGLWTSLGTSGSAVFVLAMNFSCCGEFVAHGGNLFFSGAAAGSNDFELWKSNGTTVGTVEVKDIRSGPLGSTPSDLTSIGTFLLFEARDGLTGFELWRSDGTEAGTVLVKDIRSGSPGSFPAGSLTSIGGTLYFTASDGSNGEEVWTSDGTAGNTVMLADINSGAGSGASSPQFTQFGAWIYFRASDGSNGNELWRTSGPGSGATMFENISPGSGSSNPGGFTFASSNLYFQANDGTDGPELWKTDGTNTSMVKDINPGGSGSNANLIFATGNGTEVLFAATDGVSGTELWKTDGTAVNTVEYDLNSDSSSGPRDFAKVGSNIVFTAFADYLGDMLWSFGTVDCGDAPDPTYPTLLANGGACHNTAVSNVTLGPARDADADGLPSAGADGDDLDGTDDEDGVVFTSDFNVGNDATMDVTLPLSAYLNVWIDWNADGDWDDLDDHVVFRELFPAGTTGIAVPVPSDAAVGSTYARFRVDSIGVPFVGGTTLDGEVEDYQITVSEILDFGDAPDPFVATSGEYPTLLANDGARHRVVPGVYLGSGVDADLDGQPTANAGGDDGDGNDDDDGVTFTSALIPGANATVEVVASTDGYVSGWLDFNQDGVWNFAEEYVVGGEFVTVGINAFVFSVPAGAPTGATFARFRFDKNGNGDSPTGFAQDGEVEDHQVFVGALPPVADAGLNRSIAPNNQSVALGGMPPASGGTGPYTYSWSVSPGTAGVDYMLTSPTDPNPVFTGLSEQVFTATLMVTDTNTLQDMDDALVTVEIPEQRDLFNEDLTGAETFEACGTITADLVVVKSGADITFIGPIVILGNGFVVEDGATITIINATPAGCAS